MHYNHASFSKIVMAVTEQRHFSGEHSDNQRDVFIERLTLPLVIQLCLAFGIAGLLWPEKLKPVFETLMFPWFPTYRALRNHSVAAILLSVVLFVVFVARFHLGGR